MVERLATHEVRFVVVGGLAMRALGSAVVTDDLDICYDAERENVERLSALLVSWNAYLRGAPPDLPFVADARQFRTTPVMTLTTDHGWMDVMDMVRGVGSYPEVLRASVEARLGGAPVRVLDLPGLIAAKRAAGRIKDRQHLVELEALLELRRESRG